MRTGRKLLFYRSIMILLSIVIFFILFDRVLLMILLPNIGPIVVADNVLGYRSRPLSQSTDYSNILFSHRLIDYNTGFFGQRIKAAGTGLQIRRPLILCFGDSNTFGMHAKWEDTYPAILEKELDEKVQVMNFGVCGYNTVQMYKLAIEMTTLLLPDLIIFQLFENDDQPILPLLQENRSSTINTGSHLIKYINIRRYFYLLEKYNFTEKFGSAHWVKEMMYYFQEQNVPILFAIERYPPSLNRKILENITKNFLLPISIIDFDLHDHEDDHKYNIKGSNHLNARGNKIVAVKLAEAIRKTITFEE